MKCPQWSSLGDAQRPLAAVPAPGPLTVGWEDEPTNGCDDGGRLREKWQLCSERHHGDTCAGA